MERFDYYTWDARLFETPQELIRFLCDLNLMGKKLKQINAIGAGKRLGAHEGDLYNTIRRAGVELPDGLDAYPNLDKVLVPWRVQLCEPVQLVFDDGMTLEILPVENGEYKIGINSLTEGVCDGLNRSNFDSNIFFGELLGCELSYFRVTSATTERVTLDPVTIDKPKPWTETRRQHQLEFHFGSRNYLRLISGGDDWYSLELEDAGWDGAEIPYERVQASRKDVQQVWIVSGRDYGGVFWIVPIGRETEKSCEKRWDDRYGIAIGDGAVDEFLHFFLNRFFDPSIQENDSICFDSYGGNLYSFDTIRNMVEEIRAASRLLQENYDDPVLDELKKEFSWSCYTEKNWQEVSEEEKNKLRKNRVPMAVDFYERFCMRMEQMMTCPGCDTISFAGP